jgi:hypothetical protein
MRVLGRLSVVFGIEYTLQVVVGLLQKYDRKAFGCSQDQGKIGGIFE